MNFFSNLTERKKGIVLVIVGGLLLLNTFGITWLNTLIMVGALGLIGMGLIKLEAYQQIKALFDKKKNH